MSKILFLEDRPDRHSLFLTNMSLGVDTIRLIQGVNMPDENACKKIIEQINNQNFEINNETKLIIIHRSILKNSGLSFLNQIGKSKGIRLIFFSGGISQAFYQNEGVEQINLNSTEFYSDLLIPFLKQFIIDDGVSVLQLLYKDWKLSYLMLHRQLTRNLEVTLVDNSDPYSYYNLTLNRLKKIESIIGSSNSEDINKSIKIAITNL